MSARPKRTIVSNFENGQGRGGGVGRSLILVVVDKPAHFRDPSRNMQARIARLTNPSSATAGQKTSPKAEDATHAVRWSAWLGGGPPGGVWLEATGMKVRAGGQSTACRRGNEGPCRRGRLPRGVLETCRAKLWQAGQKEAGGQHLAALTGQNSGKRAGQNSGVLPGRVLETCRGSAGENVPSAIAIWTA